MECIHLRYLVNWIIFNLENNDLYGFGWNGLGHTINQNTPQEIKDFENKNIIIKAGNYYSIALSSKF